MPVMKMKKQMVMKMKLVVMKMRRKRAMKISVIAKGKRAKASVFRGTKKKTAGGLSKKDLVKNKYGKIVSKKASVLAKKKSNLKLHIKKNGK